LSEALIRFGVENCFGINHAYVWLASYAMPASRMEDHGRRWQVELERLFATTTTTH